MAKQRRSIRMGMVLAGIAALVAVMLISLPARAEEDRPAPTKTRTEDRPAPPGDGPRERPMRERRGDEHQPPSFEGGPGRMGGEEGEFADDVVLTDEELVQAMAVLKEYDPKLASHAETVKAENPQRYRMLMRRFMPRLQRLMYLKRTDPESYELQLQDMRLGSESERVAREIQDARRAGKNDRMSELRKELVTLVTRHFDLRQKVKERQLAKLEASIKELREQIDSRRERRGELISSRVEELSAGDRIW